MGKLGLTAIRALGLAALLSAIGTGAQAGTYTSSAGGVHLGTFVVDGTNSVFRLDASSNLVTKQSGSGVLITSSSVIAPTVTVACTNSPGNCGGTHTFTVTTPTLTGLNISNITRTSGTTSAASPQNGKPISFTLSNPANQGWTVTFKVGFDMTVSTTIPGPTTGAKTLPYTFTLSH